MQWVKSHLMIVIVASVSVLSLTGLVLGYVMSSVGADLETDSRESSRLRGIKHVNPRVIDAARALQKDDQMLLENYFRKYQEAKQYKPLNDKIFLDNITDAERQLAIFDFQDKYIVQPRKLIDLLKAKDHPTADEFAEYERETKAKQDRIDKELGTGGAGPVRPQVPAVGGIGPVGAIGSDQGTSHNLRTAYAVTRAKEIYCYASGRGTSGQSSLDDRTDEVKPSGGATPSIESLWYAQVALWLQEDVFRALGGLNETVAAGLPEEARWVAYLPVKRLIRFRMGNYVAKTGSGEGLGGGIGRIGGGASGAGADLLTAGPTAVFTKRGSSDTVDVVRFGMELVVDARHLLHVLDAVSKAGFHTPLTVDLREVSMGTDEYYIYGTAPVVQMTVVCEASFMRSSYASVMPKSVKDAIAAGRAEGIAKTTTGWGGGRTPGASHPGRAFTPGRGRSMYREEPEGTSTPRGRRF